MAEDNDKITCAATGAGADSGTGNRFKTHDQSINDRNNRTLTGATGGCACGALRYRLEREPLIIHGCHCSYCQRETGSAFAINTLIESTALTLLQGNPTTVNTTSHSGQGQLITRCTDCHIAVWSHYRGFGSVVSFVRAGTLDDLTGVAPDVHIYTSTRLPFVSLPPNVPSVPEYYRMREIWSDRSMARYREAQESAPANA